MRIDAYLAAIGKSQRWLAEESGISQQLVSRTARLGNPTVATGRRLIEASRRHPAPDGGVIEWDDLQRPEELAG